VQYVGGGLSSNYIGGSTVVAGQYSTSAAPFVEYVQAQGVVSDVVTVQPQTYIDSYGQVVQGELVTEVVQTADGLVQIEQTLEGQGEMVQQVQEEQQPGPPRVVIVCTSAGQLGEQPTGAWSEEITGPYYVFQEAGCEVYIASISGGQVPVDQGSLGENFVTENDRRFEQDGCFQFLDNAYPLAEISPEAIDCVWLAGGHGTCVDFEAGLAQFITDANSMGRPIGAVCHGVIGLLSAINPDGTPLLAGKQVTGFSNAEEEQVGLVDQVNAQCGLIQQRMDEVSAVYSCGEPWTEYAIRDGKIITGQNPQSSVRAAQLCVEAMMQP
jgi:putative intracellular protease/amidase